MSTRFNCKNLLALAICSVAGVGAVTSVANAATIAWTGGTSTDWTVAANWNSGSGPAPTENFTTDIAEFNSASYAFQPDISAGPVKLGTGGSGTLGVEINGILDSGTGDVTISHATQPTYILGIGSSGIHMTSTSGNLTVDVPISVEANCSFTNDSANTLFLDGTATNAGFNFSSYGATAIDVNVTSTGAVAVGSIWSNTNGLTNQLGAFGTWGSGANTQYLTVTATVNPGGSGTDHDLGGLVGTSVDSGSGGTVAALTSLTINYEIPNLTGSATIAAGTAAKADTIHYTGGGDTITIGSGASLEANGIMNAGTGTLTISASDSTGAVVVNSGNANANGRYYMIFDAANADIDVLAPIDNLYSKIGDISTTSDGTHNVMFNALQSTGTGGLTFQMPIVIGSTRNLSVTPTNGAITLTTIGDYTPNGGAAQASTVTLNAGSTITLAAGSTYSGGTTLNGAYVAVYASELGIFGAAGTTVTVNTGTTFENSSTSGATWGTSYNYVVNGNFTLGRAGSPGLTVTGPLTLTKSLTATMASAFALGSIGDGGHGYGLTVTTAAGTGTLTLGGTDTFTGALTLLNDVGVTLGATTALNRNMAIVMDPGTSVGMSNNANTAAGLQDGPDVTSTSGGGGVTPFSSGRTLTLAGTGNYRFSGVLGSATYPANLALLWAGAGTQTLSGSNIYTNTTTVAAGTLNLDFGGFNAPTNGINILYHNVALSTMSLSGGNLQLSGSATQANSQSFGILAVNAGGSTVSLAPNATTPQDLALSTGNITRAAGGTVNFVLSGSTAAQTGTNGVLTTAANTAAGIIGGYAVVDGSDWAVSGAPATVTASWSNTSGSAISITTSSAPGNETPVSFNTTLPGSGLTAGQLYYVLGTGTTFNVSLTPGGTAINATATSSGSTATLNLQGNITALPAGSYAAFLDTATTNTSNYLLAGSGTTTNSQTTNSLKITPSDSGQSLAIGSGLTLTLASGGLLFTGNQDYTISGGTLGSSLGGGETIIQQFAANNNLTISSVLSGSLTKSGPGALTLTGLNTYTGATTLNGGVTNINSFAVGSASALGKGTATAAINFNGGTLQYATGYSGDADITGRVVTINGAGATIDTNGNTIEFTNALNNFGGGGLGGFTVTDTAGGGKLIVDGASTYQGGTTISGGTLSISTLANGGAASALGTSLYAAENLILDSGTLQYTGSGASTDRNFTITTGGGTLDASGSGSVSFTNTSSIALSGSGTHQLTLTGNNTGSNTLNPIVSDGAGGVTSLTKSGSGTWVLTANNTYSGITTITGGTLKLSAASNNIAGSSKIIVGDSLADNSAMLDVTGVTNGFVLGGSQTLAGHGTVVGNVTTSSGSILAPGNSIGTTSYSAGLTLAAGTVLDYEFAGSSSSDDSQVAGLLTLPTGTGSITLNMTDAGGLTAGTFKIFGYGTLAGGAPSSLNDTFVINPPGSPSLAGDTYSVVDNMGSNEIDLVISGSPVPEPASLALLGLGAAGLLMRRRRRA